MHSVIIAGDGACANVHIFTDGGIADVREMPHLHVRSQVRIFDLAKIAHVYALPKMSALAQVAEGGHIYIIFHDGALQQGGFDVAAVANLRVLYDRVRPQDTAFSDDRFTAQIGVWQQSGIFADHHSFFNIHQIWVKHGDTGQHITFVDASAHNAFSFCKMHPVVHAKCLVFVIHHNGLHLLSGFDGHFYHVGQVILAFG
ncbi:hypothetical protein SDC9_168512 [bioreactor metagenome]|uniref:Uncharacterized protein n=1 Tax=bioreactor metagenome TaxID=1076179 RepID=A0A645GB67_9ZZZZ